MITVVDHTEPSWHDRYMRLGRENGAATYSRQIVQHHIPVWERTIMDAVIATCGPLTGLDVEGDLAIQYLHTYPYTATVRKPRTIYDWLRPRFNRVVFVTAYRQMVDRLALEGLEGVFVPMTVDTELVASYRSERTDRHDRAIYFGNMTRHKGKAFSVLRSAFRRAGIPLDVLSGNILTRDGDVGSDIRRPLTQEEAWETVSRYGLAVGVGRCFLEASALGVPTMVCGEKFGGIATGHLEWEAQLGTNFNGRIITYDRDPYACLLARDQIHNDPGNQGIWRATEAIEKAFR